MRNPAAGQISRDAILITHVSQLIMSNKKCEGVSIYG